LARCPQDRAKAIFGSLFSQSPGLLVIDVSIQGLDALAPLAERHMVATRVELLAKALRQLINEIKQCFVSGLESSLRRHNGTKVLMN
jgi:hypothetical protein